MPATIHLQAGDDFAAGEDADVVPVVIRTRLPVRSAPP